MKFLRYVTFIVLTFAMTFSFAEEPQQITPEHKAAINHMLQAFHVEELMRFGMQKGFDNLNATDPESAAFAHELMNSITPDQIVEKLVPVYAKFYSSENAQATARFFETPAGIKMCNAMLQDLSQGKKRFALEKIPFSPSEQKTITVFSQSPAGRAFGQSQAKINEEGTLAVRAMLLDVIQRKMKQAFAPVVKAYDENLSGGVASAAIAPAYTKANPNIFDRIAAITMDSARQSQALAARYQEDLHTYGAEGLLTPQNLVSQTAITDGKSKIQHMGDNLDQYLQASDDLRKNFFEKFNALPLPSKFKDAFLKASEKSQAQIYDESIRYAENQRALLELYQRMLDFAEARLGKVTIRDNVLTFSEQSDLEIYRTLVAQIKVESEKENALVAEGRDRMKQSVQRMR